MRAGINDYRSKLKVVARSCSDRTSRAASSITLPKDISTDMSFLEMLDVVNLDLITKGEDPSRTNRLPRGHLRVV